MQIRLATIDDAQTIASIHKRSIEGSLNKFLPAEYVFGRTLERFEENWRHYFNSTRQLFVLLAIEENQIVGFIYIGLSDDADLQESEAVEVSRFYVLPEFSHRGIGKRLMDEAVSKLITCLENELVLWVFADNAPAKAFYTKYGFQFDGTTKVDCGSKLERYRLKLEQISLPLI